MTKVRLGRRRSITYLVFGPGQTLANELSLESDTLLDGETIIVFRQARLALLIHHQNELDHGTYTLSENSG